MPRRSVRSSRRKTRRSSRRWTPSEIALGRASPHFESETTLTSAGPGGWTSAPQPSTRKPSRATSTRARASGSVLRPRRSKPEIALDAGLQHANLGWFVEEYQFHPVRRWRFDFAFVGQKLAVEVEGGVFSGGRHTRGAGYAADCEKYNAATLLGWSVLRYVPRRGWVEEAVKQIEGALACHSR